VNIPEYSSWQRGLARLELFAWLTPTSRHGTQAGAGGFRGKSSRYCGGLCPLLNAGVQWFVCGEDPRIPAVPGSEELHSGSKKISQNPFSTITHFRCDLQGLSRASCSEKQVTAFPHRFDGRRILFLSLTGHRTLRFSLLVTFSISGRAG